MKYTITEEQLNKIIAESIERHINEMTFQNLGQNIGSLGKNVANKLNSAKTTYNQAKEKVKNNLHGAVTGNYKNATQGVIKAAMDTFMPGASSLLGKITTTDEDILEKAGYKFYKKQNDYLKTDRRTGKTGNPYTLEDTEEIQNAYARLCKKYGLSNTNNNNTGAYGYNNNGYTTTSF